MAAADRGTSATLTTRDWARRVTKAGQALNSAAPGTVGDDFAPLQVVVGNEVIGIGALEDDDLELVAASIVSMSTRSSANISGS